MRGLDKPKKGKLPHLFPKACWRGQAIHLVLEGGLFLVTSLKGIFPVAQSGR